MGVIAQELESKMEEHGITHEEFAVISKSIGIEVPIEENDQTDDEKDNNITSRIKDVHINDYDGELSDDILHYGINTDQILYAAVAGLQREKKRNDQLEERLAKLEALLIK